MFFCHRHIIGRNIQTQTKMPRLDEEGKIMIDPNTILKEHARKL